MNMNTTRKTTKEATADKQTEVVETITSLYTSSVERLAEAQKKALDVALEQNADLMGAWKKIAQVVPGTPVPNILDLVANTFGQFVDLQKGAIDLALEQSQTLAALANERVDSVSKATDAVATIVQDTVERAAVNQKNAIEFAATQTKTAFDNFKKQSGVAGTPAEAAAESIQRGFETLVETQKGILNIASKRPQSHKASA
jgi:5'-3' exonuclease